MYQQSKQVLDRKYEFGSFHRLQAQWLQPAWNHVGRSCKPLNQT